MKLINSIKLISVFSFLLLLSLGVSAYGPTHPSVNTWGTKGLCNNCEPACIDSYNPSMPWSSLGPFLNDHLDWLTDDGTCPCNYFSRSQPDGVYYNAHHVLQEDTGGNPGSDYLDLINYFQSRGIRLENGFAHWKTNTIQNLSDYYSGGGGSSQEYPHLIPGWDPVNDPNGDDIRNWKTDFAFVIPGQPTQFSYSGSCITVTGRSWTSGEWVGDFVRMGYGSDTQIEDFTVSSSTSNTLCLNRTIPSNTYIFFYVDKASAPNHNAIAMTPDKARIQVYGKGQTAVNISNSTAKDWAVAFAVKEVQSMRPPCNGPLGIFHDNVWDQFVPEKIGTAPWQGSVYGGTYLEPELLLSNPQNPDRNFSYHLRDVLIKIKQALTANIPGTTYVIGNPWNIGGNFYFANDVTDGSMLEGYMDYDTPLGTFNSKKSDIERMQAKEKYLFFHFKRNSTADQVKILALSSYYILKDDKFYFLFGTEPSYGVGLSYPDRWWFGLMEIDIGMPAGPATLVTQGSNQAWRRDFSKGIVFSRPRNSGGGSMTINLGSSYYNLNADGTQGAAVSSITLTDNGPMGMGVVLIPAGPIPECSTAGGTCYANACSTYTSCTSINGSCTTGYCCSGSCTGANSLPTVTQVQCERNTSGNWVTCNTLSYNDLLLRVRASCTDPDGTVARANFSLTNVPDSNTFFSQQTTTQSSGYWVYDNADLRLNDSGQFNLVASCTDNLGGQGSSTVSWSIPWGKLITSLITPTADANVTLNQSFTFTSRVDCTGGECGSLSATLDPTVTLDYTTGIDDSGLSRKNENVNIGNGEVIYLRRSSTDYNDRRALLKFNLSSISPGSIVSSASLRLYIDSDDLAAVTLSLYPIANGRNWSELTVTNVYYDGSNPWTALGADNAPNDHDGTAVDSISLAANQQGFFTVQSAAFVSLVQQWVSGSRQNNGLIITPTSPQSDAYSYLFSSETASTTQRPQLTITYTSGSGGTKGIVSTTVGAQPFYTTSSNPQTNCANLKGGQSCTNTWSVMPTGNLGSRWEFFSEYTPTTYAPPLVDSNQTKHLFLTISSGTCTNGTTRSCSIAHQGICAVGTETCTNNVWGGCPSPQTEICSNGTDEDCSGADLTCSLCPEGQITQRCLCGGTAYNTGYCCSNVYQSSACTVPCTPNWQCGDWSSCLNGSQTRTCTDINCNSTPRTESQSCGICTPGQTQSCTIDNCNGSQTCSEQGAWNPCIKADLCCGVNCNDNNDCTTDSCSIGACSNTVIPNCGTGGGGGGGGGGPTLKEFSVELNPSTVNAGANFMVTAKDSSSGNPVENASVTYAKTTQYTNAQGQTEFTATEGYSLVTVKKDGYNNKTVRITVTGQEPSSLCGNSICDLGENHGNCSQDCPKGKKTSLRVSTENPEVVSGQTIDVLVTLDNGSAVPDATVVYAGKTYTTNSEGMVALTTEKGFNSITARADAYEPGAMLLQFITAKTECGNSKCEEGEDAKSCPIDCIGEKPFDLMPFTAPAIALILIVFFVVMLMEAKKSSPIKPAA
ncbi:MAG: DNRLRE domain-containing protein [Candidatus Diapherotrites archaeon]